MPCPSVIYSGRYDGALFITPSPWTKCYVHITTLPDDPFSFHYHISAVYQPDYELVWLHGTLIDLSTQKRIFVYKPFRPYESSTPSD